MNDIIGIIFILDIALLPIFTAYMILKKLKIERFDFVFLLGYIFFIGIIFFIGALEYDEDAFIWLFVYYLGFPNTILFGKNNLIMLIIAGLIQYYINGWIIELLKRNKELKILWQKIAIVLMPFIFITSSIFVLKGLYDLIFLIKKNGNM